MTRSFLLLVGLLILSSCAEVVFSGNGVTPCGTDLPWGRCPQTMTCCRGFCYSAEFLPRCLMADAMATDHLEDGSMDEIVDATSPTDTGDVPDIMDALLDIVDVGDGSLPRDGSDADEIRMDVADADALVTDGSVPDGDTTVVAMDMSDSVGMMDGADAIGDRETLDTSRTDVLTDRDVATGDTVVIMDVPMDRSQDAPADTLPDVVDVTPTDRPPDIVCIIGQIVCGDICVDAQTSMTNCGRCNNVCAAGSAVCVAGTCVSLTGRLTLRARRAVLWMSEFMTSFSLETVREGMDTSRNFDTGELRVAAYRYMGTTSLRLARTGIRFDRIVTPTGTPVREIGSAYV